MVIINKIAVLNHYIIYIIKYLLIFCTEGLFNWQTLEYPTTSIELPTAKETG